MSVSNVVQSGTLLDPAERSFLGPVAWLHAVNPFHRRWERRLREALGPERLAGLEDGSRLAWGPLGTAKDGLSEPLAQLVPIVAARLRAGVSATAEELAVYQGAAIYHLWDQFGDRIQRIVDENGVAVSFYDDFLRAYGSLFEHPGLVVPEPGHLLALFYQARRACSFITTKIAGRSGTAGRSREAIWLAIFGSDVYGYTGELYKRMDDFSVLITGETGTGKDLAAECIGWSRYIPFDVDKRRFATTFAGDFHAHNLCEVPAELVESALFGHKKGSFTGASTDMVGWLELPEANGTLFLDEVGEIPLHVQPKLLRPLQNREILRIGESKPRRIKGRFLFATLRDLEAMSQRGEFRADLFERMNVIRVHMPSLRELRADGGLLDYVDGFVGAKLDDQARRCAVTMQVMRSIQDELGDYDWPRNLRELKNFTERCLLRLDETGPDTTEPSHPDPAPTVTMEDPRSASHGLPEAPASVCVPSSDILGQQAKAGAVDYRELLRAYVTRIYVLTGQNKAETARLTGFHRRTLAQWIDPVRLARLIAASK
jgi:DNA-binding NtrC family response regulator